MSRLNPLSAGAQLGDGTNAGVYLGEVTRIDADGTVYVEVPRIAAEYEFPGRAGADYTPTVGDNVAVGFLEGGREELIILLRLP